MGALKVSGVCRLGTEPELKFTPSGQAVCSARAIFQDRYQDRQTGEWKDGKAVWVSLVGWRQLGENMAESFRKGDDVIVLDGTLEVREFDLRDGGKGHAVEITAREIGPSIRFAAASSQRVDRQSEGPAAGSGDPWGQEPPREEQQARPAARQQPGHARQGQWSNGQSTSRPASSGSAGFADEPPF